LSKKTGKTYRLLSEAEWEYVARAGTTTPFHTGEQISTSQANFDGNYTYNGSSKGEFRDRTVPVGSFGANQFGLHDVHGNVVEWVQDCWNGNYKGAPSDGSAWTTGDCEDRVLRGGSWLNDPWILRSAIRDGYRIDIRINLFGFRVARTLPR
ncbi:MAG: formylglycine-generating enzyme family protein, partial [Gemmatimonadetes bacterium]|nr:formylglycine-generating enzyme family protein [Gemmatimonadota bacterium]